MARAMLTLGFYGVGGNRYLKKAGYTDCSVKSCIYEREHMFFFLTGFDDQAARMATYNLLKGVITLFRSILTSSQLSQTASYFL